LHFREDINGLRAVAVIAVLLFHFDPTWLPGGFAGVDVFFVISGFLMTAIIYRGLEQQRFSLLKFYIARANRIIPALAVLCIALLLFGFFYLTPWEYRALGKHAASSIGFVSNIIYWMESGYFDAASKQKWLLHTWSLAVEWQFYIIYPLLLMLLAKLIPLQKVKTVILVGTVAGLLFSVISTELWPDASYYLLSSRAWQMMLGGVAFFYPLRVKAAYQLPLEWFGLALIIFSYCWFSKDNAWPGYLALLPALGVFLVIQAQRQKSLLTNNVVMQKIGASSYSIYLWHWPVVVFGYYFAIPNWFIAGIPISFALGWLSYKYVESHSFNKFTRIIDVVKVVPLYLAVFTGLLGSVVFIRDGANLWLTRQRPVVQQTYQVISQHFSHPTNWGAKPNQRQNLAPCRFNIETLTKSNVSRLQQCYQRYGKGILILGDSHAIDLYGVVASRFEDAFLVGITSVGCRPHRPDPNCPYQDVLTLLSQTPLFKHIIYEQGGFYLLRDKRGDKGSRRMFSDLSLSEAVAGITVATANVHKVLNYLIQLSSLAPVTWFGSRIEPHITNRQILEKGCNFGFSLRPNQQQPFRTLDDYISTAVSAHKNIKYVSQNQLFKFDFSQDLLTCSNKFWDDGDHFSSAGEERFGRRLPDNFLLVN
jgi:peptidoglycan/LPS O-acetylase OafA/YrhL